MPLNGGPSRVPGAAAHLLDEVYQHANGAAEPEQRIDQIDPDCVLHALNATIALRIGMDIHVAKDPEHGDPEDEQNGVPDEEQRDADDDRDHVDECGDGAEGPDGHSVTLLFCISRRLQRVAGGVHKPISNRWGHDVESRYGGPTRTDHRPPAQRSFVKSGTRYARSPRRSSRSHERDSWWAIDAVLLCSWGCSRTVKVRDKNRKVFAQEPHARDKDGEMSLLK